MKLLLKYGADPNITTMRSAGRVRVGDVPRDVVDVSPLPPVAVGGPGVTALLAASTLANLLYPPHLGFGFAIAVESSAWVLGQLLQLADVGQRLGTFAHPERVVPGELFRPHPVFAGPRGLQVRIEAA